jgi:hypothetical protein
MRKIVLTFGLLAGAIMSAMLLLAIPFEDAMMDGGMLLGYTTMVAAFMLIYFGVRSYRDNVAGGSIGFGRAFGVGMLIAFVAALCYVVTWEAIFYKLNPGFTERYAAHALESARADGKSAEEIAALRVEMDKFAVMYQNPFINSAFTFMEPMPVALIISLVTAGVLSRRRKDVAGAPAAMRGAAGRA